MADGFAGTAKVITSAALIMISAFASFLLMVGLEIKMFAVRSAGVTRAYELLRNATRPDSAEGRCRVKGEVRGRRIGAASR